jgi:hypothetical protein
MALQLFAGPWPLFQFLDLFTQSVGPLRKAATCIHHKDKQNNKRTETPVPQVGFQPTIPVFKRAKAVHALYRAATVFGCYSS